MNLATLVKSSINISTITVLVYLNLTQYFFSFSYAILLIVFSIILVLLSLNIDIVKRIFYNSETIIPIVYLFLSLYIYAYSPITDVKKLIQDTGISLIIVTSYYVIIYAMSFFLYTLKEDVKTIKYSSLLIAILSVATIDLVFLLFLYWHFDFPYGFLMKANS